MTGYDPTDVDAQERNRLEAADKARIVRKQKEDDLKWLMSGAKGRRIVWDLLEQSGVFQMSFDKNALQMAFNEGGRNYGNRIFARVMQLCPDLYAKMTEEQNVRTDDGSGDHSN